MKRLAIIALAVVSATAWGQGADPKRDPLPPEDPPAAPRQPDVPKPGDLIPVPFDPPPIGSAGSAAGSGSADPGPGTGSGTGSGSGAGPGTGSGSGAGPGTGSGAGPGTGSGSGSGSAIVIIIPPDVAAPEVSASASPSQLQLGERFTLFITAAYEKDVEVNLREPIELGGAFEVKRKVSKDIPRADGKMVREWQLEVYAWDVGDLRVPQLAVTFTSQGKAGQVATNSVPIRVLGVLGDVVDDPKLVRDNAPPVTLMSRDWFWVWIAAGVGALVFGLGSALWIHRRRKRRVRTLIGTLVASTPTPRRIDMTSERALEQLLAIERSGVLDRDDERKPGYASMVDVIREYLGARYRVATLDKTTAELMRSLAKVAPDDERKLVAEWLERCDIVKYGGFKATADDAHSVLEGARSLVMATTRAPGSSMKMQAAA